MSLSRKLARLSGVGPTGRTPARETTYVPDEAERGAEPEDARWSAFRSALGQKAARANTRRDAEREASPIPGETTETEHGPLHRVIRRYPLDHRHGRVAVAPARNVPGLCLARLGLDTSLSEVDASRLVFLDTETTGLAGGTGTIPFLIGIGYFEPDALVVEQWLLRRYGQEAPMLHALEARLRDASGIVTYNGKSFDWPLLRTRYVLARRSTPPVNAHVDLLHCARRLVKHRVTSARLVEIERTLLGFVREDDIDGALIPEVFLALAKHGHHPDVARVIEHNAMDLVAMPALLGHLAAQLDGTARDTDARDHLACARVYARADDDEGVARFAARALDAGQGEDACHALVLAARQARRRGDFEDEARWLVAALERAHDDVMRACVHLELAKHFEHRRKDTHAAIAHARAACEAEGEDASRRRLARLEARSAQDGGSRSSSRPRARS